VERAAMRLRSVVPVLSIVVGLFASAPLAAASPPKNPAVAVEAPPSSEKVVGLPNEKKSLKFIVLGDFGDASQAEYGLAAQLVKFWEKFKVNFVLTVGDNLYGAERPQDFKMKFEEPYKPMLDAGVKFYAVLGNHDARAQRYYKPFNMDGKLYYTLKAPEEDVRFFMLDSTYPVPEQIDWFEKELKSSDEKWKIAVFHHPIYSSGGRHGSDLKLRQVLEPLFLKYNVSVALTGHDHFYERIKPQHGVVHFVVGSGGRLAPNDIKQGTGITGKGFDTDNAFLAVEIVGDTMYFTAISRTGQVVDSGTIKRREPGSD